MLRRAFVRLFPVALAIPACVGDSPAGPADTGAPDVAILDATADATPDAAPPPCALNKPFDAPTPFDAVNSDQDDFSLRFSADRTHGYFARGTISTSSSDIFVSTAGGGFADGVPLAGVNSPSGFLDATPALSANELEIFFSTNDNTVDAGAGFHVWRATRSGTNSNFNGRTPLAALTGVSVVGLHLSADGKTLYFSDAADGTIKSSARISGSQFGAPKAEFTGTIPVVAADGLSLYFTKGNDVWVARRASSSSVWQPAVAVSELNTTATENPTDVSPDGCVIYFESNRPASKLGYNMWMAKKPPN